MINTSDILLVISNPAAAGDDMLLYALASGQPRIVFVHSCREAYPFLDASVPLSVVVCDLSLPDGNWCNILRYATEAHSSARIVVRTDYADERLWSEALWRGVFDLLIEPYSAGEARRVIEGAIRADCVWSGPAIRPRQAASERAAAEPMPAGAKPADETRRSPANGKTVNRKVPRPHADRVDVVGRFQAAS